MMIRGLNTARLFAMTLALAGGLVAGCGGESSDGAFVTSVTHQPDGTTSEKTSWLTSDELAKMDGERTALAALGGTGAAPSLDTGCAGASMWIFDGGSQTGNRICFAGTGTDNLASYTAPGGGNWSQKAKSFWGGVYSASFRMLPSHSFLTADPWARGDFFTLVDLLKQPAF